MTPFESILGVAWPADIPGWIGVLVAITALVLSWFSKQTPKISFSLWVGIWAGIAFALSVGYIHHYLQGGPRIIDATSYWLEARGFASGRIVWPIEIPTANFRGRFLIPQHAEEGSFLGVIFPPGYPLLLAGGFLLGLPMLVGPLLAAGLTVLTALLARVITGREEVGRIAAVLSAFNACLRYHTADTMSHGLAALLMAGAVIAGLQASRSRRPIGWLVCGAASGWLACTRPATALALLAVGIPAILYWMKKYSSFNPLWILAGALPFLSFLLFHQHALTGAWLSSAQTQYYLLADGPPGCFRYGFGSGIGCLVEHGSYVKSVAPNGYGLAAALTTTGRRFYLHLADLMNFAPFAILIIPGILTRQGRAPEQGLPPLRSRWSLPSFPDKPNPNRIGFTLSILRKSLCKSAKDFVHRERIAQSWRLSLAWTLPLATMAAYAPFYFDGSYPGGGARMLVDAMAFEHVLIALGLSAWAARFRNPKDGHAWAIGTAVVLCSLGFSLHASHMHLALRDRDGGRPLFEPQNVQSALGSNPRGLLFVDTDHGFNLAHDPASQDPFRSLVVARARHDARDQLLWERLGRPPSHRYVYHPFEPNPLPARVEPWLPTTGDGVLVFEVEAEWPPIHQSGGYAAPTHLGQDGCVSAGRALALHRVDEEVCVTTEIPMPSSGTYDLRAWIVSGEVPKLRSWLEIEGKRENIAICTECIESLEKPSNLTHARSCMPMGDVKVLASGQAILWTVCSETSWLALDRVELRPRGGS